MSTYVVTFIATNGGVAPHQHVGNLAFARGVISVWVDGDHYDRVCVLEVPSPSARTRTGFQGKALVFNREGALRWARN